MSGGGYSVGRTRHPPKWTLQDPSMKKTVEDTLTETNMLLMEEIRLTT